MSPGSISFHLFIHFFLEFPFLLLPIMALFLLAIGKSSPRTIAIVIGLLGAFYFLAVYPSHLRGHFSFLLQPTLRDYPGDELGRRSLENMRV